MKRREFIKRIIDAAMLILLPVLMAEILTGQQIHEWLGTGMVLLFLLHHILNFGWMRNLFKGTYSPLRCAGTALNIILLFDFLALAFSGIIMSGFVFAWLPFSRGMITARTLHLFASHWGLILMSLLTGMHWKLILSMCKKKLPEIKERDVFLWLLRGVAFGTVLFGLYASSQQKMTDYLFMRTHFVFFDETKSVFLFYTEVAAMIGMFLVAGHYFGMILQKWRCGEKQESKEQLSCGKKIAKVLAFCIPVVVIIVVIFSLNRGGSKPEDTWVAGSSSQEEITKSENPSQEETTPSQTGSSAGVIQVILWVMTFR